MIITTGSFFHNSIKVNQNRNLYTDLEYTPNDSLRNCSNPWISRDLLLY